MSACISCRENIPVGARFCPSCGAGNPLAHEATVTAKDPPLPPAHCSPSSDSIDDARFTPGTILAERYRIVGLLGKGGMGEVYRADDLKLRQPVALKFLPASLAADGRRLERFHHEVRVAREVSHPNVCRVYDIGEADGQAFLSMEYVDGEDLASLLRRVGRPSKEKGLQIARQLCAGLAAAHDKGVLHRDLKPHNVMIDKEGRVRITDFGLAGFVEDFAGKEIRAGTPAYMSPEQLSGQGVSVKSDLYALGLVLCEVFTGKRLFEGTTREQVDRSRSSLPTSLSELVEDLDPVIERVILRCLEPAPTARPSSALAVAAALPGGDPLAAALEAGETPSPEMVANAGGVGTMHPLAAAGCVAAIFLGTIGLMIGTDSILKRIRPDKPPQVLADRAKEILKKIGHSAPANDTAYDFRPGWSYFRYIEDHDLSPRRWDRISSQRPSLLSFWYRQSSWPMIPAEPVGRVGEGDPPFDVSGMARVWLDHAGRLEQLEVNPPQKEDESALSKPPPATNWSLLFTEAGLDETLFTSVPPQWTPNHYCDERAAWTGFYSNQPDTPIRVDAGAYRGQPVWFQFTGPWSFPWRMQEWPQTTGEKAASWFFLVLFVATLLGGILLARHNLKLRRGDRAGANRLFTAILGLSFLSNMLRTAHVAGRGEFDRVMNVAQFALFFAAILWLFYIALEPYVRRRWPQMLISWGRLFAGRWRDPLVGRDILVGGVLQTMVLVVHRLVEPQLKALVGGLPQRPFMWTPPTLLGSRDLLADFVSGGFLIIALVSLLLLFGLRVMLRKQWLTVVVAVLIWTIPTVLSGWSRTDGWTLLIKGGAEAFHGALIVWALIRFGLLAAACMWFLERFMDVAQYLDLSSWYAAGPLTAFLILLAFVGYGFFISTAGRSWLKRDLLEA